MTSPHKRFNSDQVIAFFRGTKLSDKADNKAEETFSECIGVDLACLQGDESPQAVTDDKDTGAVGVYTFISFPAQDDMDIEQTAADQPYSPLELFRLFITDDLRDHFVEAMKAYPETQKNKKRLMYSCTLPSRIFLGRRCFGTFECTSC